MSLHPSALNSLSLADAQRDMCRAYLDGAPGVLVSGAAWLAGGVACIALSPGQAVWTLFIGGALIHPVSVLVLKALGRPGQHTRGNPLGGLALSMTCWMILSLPLAYAVSLLRMDWFFPAMLFVIGGRYLTAATLYGKRVYLAFGAALALTGYALAALGAAPATGAFAGAAVEAVFGFFMLAKAPRSAAA